MNEKYPIFNEIITVMKRVRDNDYPFDISIVLNDEDIGYWEEPVTEENAVHCGTPACVAGWYMLSPEGQARGFYFNPHGAPCHESGTFSSGFDVLIGMLADEGIEETEVLFAAINGASEFYGVADYSEITPAIVVDRLERLVKEYENES